MTTIRIIRVIREVWNVYIIFYIMLFVFIVPIAKDQVYTVCLGLSVLMVTRVIIFVLIISFIKCYQSIRF